MKARVSKAKARTTVNRNAWHALLDARHSSFIEFRDNHANRLDRPPSARCDEIVTTAIPVSTRCQMNHFGSLPVDKHDIFMKFFVSLDDFLLFIVKHREKEKKFSNNSMYFSNILISLFPSR